MSLFLWTEEQQRARVERTLPDQTTLLESKVWMSDVLYLSLKSNTLLKTDPLPVLSSHLPPSHPLQL